MPATGIPLEYGRVYTILCRIDNFHVALMKAADRIVVSLPLSELWNSGGPIGATNQRALGKKEIADMLRSGTLRFVVADCGGFRARIALISGSAK